MKLDQSISELLYRYDCVIVPDFGGFIANYKPAKINSKTDMFSPPAKQISFNRALVVNDGLLANQIANNYGVRYAEALNSIENCVQAYHRDLKAGKRVVIEKVGLLYLDANNKIIFEPRNTVNYLTDAFGLEKFHVPKIQNEETKVVPLKTKKRFIHPGRVAAAIFIPLFIAGTWFAYQVGSSGKYGNLQLSDFGFGMGQKSYEVRRPVEVEPEQPSIDLAFEAIEARARQKVFEKKTVEPALTPKANWFVIGGCFSEKSNANKFLKKLKRKGYKAQTIPNYKSLEAVAYGGFTNESEARNFLTKVKAKENKSAWLLKK